MIAQDIPLIGLAEATISVVLQEVDFGAELTEIDCISGLRTGRHIGDLASVGGRTYRYGGGPVGHRSVAQSNRVFGLHYGAVESGQSALLNELTTITVGEPIKGH